MADYSFIDGSPIVRMIFYPRRDYSNTPPNAFDLNIPVDEGVTIACRGYVENSGCPWILYFHGNGEVVSDYDGIAPMYNRKGINLLVADYRGYGSSTGTPGLNHMIGDAHKIYGAVRAGLADRGFKEDLWVMGRSLGSLSAMELAWRHNEEIRGLIIESGFISVVKLMRRLSGGDLPAELEAVEEENIRKAGEITAPALVIHGEEDSLVPLERGEEIYQVLGSPRKELYTIPRAGHNDIMFVDARGYMEAIANFMFGQNTRS